MEIPDVINQIFSVKGKETVIQQPQQCSDNICVAPAVGRVRLVGA